MPTLTQHKQDRYFRTLSMNEFPSLYFTHTKYSELTVGDMHGNALKLIQWLAQHGIVKIEKHKNAGVVWSDLVNIYKKIISSQKPNQKTKKQLIENFINLVKTNFKVDNRQCYQLRFLGDILCDRGASDLLNLTVFDLLNENNVNYTICLSNHDSDYILRMQKDNGLISGSNLSYTNDLNDGDDAALKDSIFKKAYAPKLKLIDYAISDNDKQLVLYTHAPITIDDIQNISRQLDIKCAEDGWSSLQGVCRTIDKLNHKFSSLLKGSSNFSKFYYMHNGTYSPLMKFVWQRYGEMQWGTNTAAENKVNANQIDIIHGHVGETTDLDRKKTHNDVINAEINYINLDNDYGKFAYYSSSDRNTKVFFDATLNGKIPTHIQCRIPKLSVTLHKNTKSNRLSTESELSQPKSLFFSFNRESNKSIKLLSAMANQSSTDNRINKSIHPEKHAEIIGKFKKLHSRNLNKKIFSRTGLTENVTQHLYAIVDYAKYGNGLFHSGRRSASIIGSMLGLSVDAGDVQAKIRNLKTEIIINTLIQNSLNTGESQSLKKTTTSLSTPMKR